MIISVKRRIGYGLFILVLSLLVLLGWWQLQRGMEKAEIARVSKDYGQQYLTFDAVSAPVEQFDLRFVNAQGSWVVEKTLLLENRIYQGRAGYEVLVPFQLAGDNSLILVNRGWVSKEQSASLDFEQIDSAISIIKGQVSLPKKGFTLGDTYSGEIHWPLAVLYYDFDAISEAIGQRVVPLVVVLDKEDPHGFTRIWKPATISPERHYAYTAQWWGLALTLIIFGFIWRTKTAKPE